MVLSLLFLFHQWELFVYARGRRLLPNLVNFWCSLFGLIFCFSCHYVIFRVLPGISVESTIHMNSNCKTREIPISGIRAKT